MDLKLPALGEGADSGTVVNVFVKEGDQITKDQALIELENEKAVATIPATAAGTVAKVFVKTGDKISVGHRILSLGDGVAGEPAGAPPKPAPASKPKAEAARPESTSEPQEAGPQEPQEGEPVPQPKPGIGPAASPSLRKLARDLGIDLARIRGSHAGGRIVLEDVRAYIQRLQAR